MGAHAVTDDALLATAIAAEAGKLLLAIRAEGRETGKALGDRADAQANALILERLRTARPDAFVLSEESADDKARCAASQTWIVDPLDGTREYAEGRDDWAVHIALAVGGRAAAGAVALPALGIVLSSSPAPIVPPAPPRPRMVVSRTRPAPQALAVAEAIGAELIPMGSAGAKAMAVVRGEADIYLHAGGQYEWDSCAPVAVALAAGLHASRIDGTPLYYNCHDTWLPDLLICRPADAARILPLIGT
ncbi:3'(2'),5'-bisphosphate nucleotidase CysQ [Sphingomonas sp. Leaf16]|nr:3'(2'),5'-bisphosphate nucleotidase CysQ [Sphingomonas sp. Leaf16]KQN11207.1 3'(2'),5'-bisphosphate nucleotidase CysQ [Sphingomonas sp. Leaf29]KQN18506.1 3'(2'),5'-bisphosphate nucleotidase CysQ [Sphingomonas sp. Leaf32]